MDFGHSDTSRLIYLGIFILLIGAGFFHGGWRKASRDIQMLGVWALLLLALVAVYGFKDDFKTIGNRLLGTLMPGRAVEEHGQVVVTRNRGGMFEIKGQINGIEMNFLVDTGASSISLTHENAVKIGFAPSLEDYSIRLSTANGETFAAPITLKNLTIGSINRQNIRARVAKPGAMDINLLGHGFLNELSSYEVRGDRLILRP